MKISNQMIQWAVEALKDAKIVNNNNEYKSEFNGYISSLGAAIIQSGLLPAMIFFENKDSEAQERCKVTNAIRYIINKKQKYSDIQNIAKYILEHPNDEKSLKKDITEAAVSLKLALRMYKKEKND
jgi:CRISPR-associated protein Cmr5